jgi:glycosidase
VAWNVPGDFWRDCIGQLRKMKSIFMLAEGDKPYLYENGFDAGYPWDMFHKMVQVAKGERPAFVLDSVLHYYDSAYPRTALEMYFTSNHDENSWNGSDFSTFPGDAHAPFAVFTQTMPKDVPLIYGGQEEPVLRAIPFFEKDTIRFGKFARAAFYKTLLALRQRNIALDAEASFRKISAGDERAVYAFVREKAGKKIFVLLNLSDKPERIAISDQSVWGKPRDIFAAATVYLDGTIWTLEPWGYRVYEY